MTAYGKKKLILPLVILTVCLFAGLGIFYYANRLLSTPVTIENIEVDTRAALKLNLLEQVSKKNGITEWELKATSATLLREEDKAILEDVAVVFYTKTEEKVHLTAEQGVLHTKTHDLTLNTNVVVTSQGRTLRSETLHYGKKEHIIHTDSRVLIEDGESTLEADTMRIELNDNRIILKGKVKGYFSEAIDLP
ncbi:MAG TPA: LPS export ABC transporter periplasmic protein LptC [Desulfobacteraceae bacterium]|nr:LPS export ABC transporter periplasmic protein LptC [Desulfobacteraceae bacterium]|tara:strand:- start:716 stop:1294 length:579 start_codon:yes stop_codon:yes gene_type:complete